MGFFDTLLTAIAPERAVKRVAAQTAIRAINSGYSNYGASLHKKSMRGWMWHGGSPKEDIEDNLRVLRERSRDAYMGVPLATGAIKTMRTNVVCGGLTPTPQIDNAFLGMENILKVFLMAFPEWLACIFMVVGLVVTALAAVRLGYGLVVAKTVYKWIVNAEEKFGSGAGAEKKAHVIAVLRGYTPDWLDWAINERTLDWIVQLVFDFTKKKLEDYMAKKSAETTTVAHFGNVGENKRND